MRRFWYDSLFDNLEKKSLEERNQGRRTERDTEVTEKVETIDIVTETKNGDETGTEVLWTDILGTMEKLTGLQGKKMKINGEEDRNKRRQDVSDLEMIQTDLHVLATSPAITGTEFCLLWPVTQILIWAQWWQNSGEEAKSFTIIPWSYEGSCRTNLS